MAEAAGETDRRRRLSQRALAADPDYVPRTLAVGRGARGGSLAGGRVRGIKRNAAAGKTTQYRQLATALWETLRAIWHGGLVRGGSIEGSERVYWSWRWNCIGREPIARHHSET